MLTLFVQRLGIAIVYGLLDFGRRNARPVGEIKDLDAEIFQIVVFAIPVIPHYESVYIQFFDDLRVIQRMLRNHDVRCLQGFKDLQTLDERNNGRCLV